MSLTAILLPMNVMANEGEAKTITIAWTNIMESQQEIWEKYIFEPFEEKHPEVTIDFQCLPDLQNTVRVQVAAGAGPDMFYMDSVDIPDYASTNRILSLENYRKEYNLDDSMYDWAIRSCLYEDEMYALPASVEATAMTYNKNLLDQLGKDVPTNREEFVDVCNAALEAGLIPVSFGYSGANLLLTWPYEHYLTCYAGGEKTAQLLKGEITFDDPDIKGAFELLKADWDAGYINDKKSGAITNDEARILFANQKAVFNYEGPWLILADGAAKTWDFEWGQCAWPSMKDGTPAGSAITLGEAIGINANSQVSDLCMEMMMDFYSNEELMAQAVAEGFSTPAVPIDSAAYPEDMDENIRKALDAQNENMNLETVGYAPWGFFPAKTTTFLDDNLDKVFYDKMDLDTFIDKANETIAEDFADGYVFAG
jgi:ABC-type glycerol-3-phosphate transport system substrate-binding protein